ncbi:hypothetical protein M758_3G034600 [Ceratodon purpureus]|nr:hypothetical protein M758_3G034600 [Ceratodon purpureus]
MRECKRHPSESQPGGGVCARCLEERLLWLWKGESFRGDDPEEVPSASTSAGASVPEQRLGHSGSSHNPDARPEPAASSIASVRKQLQVHGVARPGGARARAGVSSDVVNGDNHRDGVGLGAVVVASSGDGAERTCVGDGDPGFGNLTLHDSKGVMEEWTEFHARRRRNLEPGLEGELDSCKAKSKSFDLIEAIEAGASDDATMDTENVQSVARNPELVILMNAQKMRSQSMPLDNRSAEDTALRVINEQADDLFFDEFDAYGIAEDVQDRDGGGEALQESMAAQRCFSPVWQSRKSPKWVKVLVSPMTSRNRVFPSRSKEDARKGRGSRKRGARFASSDWSGSEAHRGGSSPQWMGSSRAEEEMPAHPRTSMRSSVFSWLKQDADTTHHKRYDQREQLTSSSSSSLTNSVSTDSWLRDLTTVGHLHEIAEEMEIVEESSEEENDLGDMTSFGKFLLLAAQRQPEARLTRLVSANSK